MKLNKISVLSIIVTIFTISACTANYMAMSNGPKMGQMEAIEEKINSIASELFRRMREFDPENKTVAVTTFVRLDDLEASSSFGRFVAERLSMELHNLGFNIRELRQRKEIEFKKTKGEFALTRNSKELMKRFQVDALLTGTYLVVGNEVVVNAKFIDIDSSRVISVGHAVADLNTLRRIRDMLPADKKTAPVVKVVHIEEG